MPLIIITFSLFVAIIIIDIVHYGAMILFLRGIGRKAWKMPSEPFTPKTMVVLTLRGADPFLERCVRGLLSQNYPCYDIRFVVDHLDDSALPIVQKIIHETGAANVEILVVNEHSETCSLKCNSLVHAVETLDESYEIVAFLDADVNPHSDWLRDLVEPLSDPQFGAVTGQRWYIPDRDNFGSLIRYLWNAAAIVQMYLYGMAWGGSLALRRRVFSEGKLCDTWKHAFSDDMSVGSSLRNIGVKTAFAPSLFMVNREECTLSSFHRWVKRQLFCAKLYHPAWRAVVAQAALITIPLLSAFFLLLISLVQGNHSAAAWSFAALVAYWTGVFGTLPFMERGIRNKLRERNEPLSPWTLRRTLRTFIAVPLTQFVYTSALFWLHFMKKVEWRGVWYEIGRDKTVRMIEYIPFAEVQKRETSLSDDRTSL
jgi:cellulose synthase/poly-beta-1,6-N-acetylglucosamine synthase-like glycosyltransferase